MSRHDTALLVVDVQEKLLPLIPGQARMVWNVRRLIDGAKLLGMSVLATEQYPKGLGHTPPVLAQRLGTIPEKLTFSCGECGELFAGLGERGVHRMLVCGIETHVCVNQTVLDLLGHGVATHVVADAVASRTDANRELGLHRMERAGATITSVETALFELLGGSDAPAFKEVQALVK